LTEIDLKNVTIIGEAALGGNKLTSIVIPQTVKVIGDYSFKRCIDLASVEFSDSPSVFYIGTDAFDQTSLSEFCVPATVTFLGSGMIGNSEVDYIDVDPANEYYVSVDGVVYTKDMKTLTHYPPKKVSSLYEIPDTVTEIGAGAFSSCLYISGVSIPDSVTIINKEAFSKCESMTDVVMSTAVTEIGEHAFYNCLMMNDIDLSKCTALKSIGQQAFSECSCIKKVNIPASVESIGERAFCFCKSLESFSVDPSNKYYRSVDGALYDKDMKVLIQYPNASAQTSFTVPSGVEIIGQNAFSLCWNLNTLVFPDSVTTLSNPVVIDHGQSTSPITKLVFGKGLTTVGSKPFTHHHFFESKDSTEELPPTADNLRGHTFVGETSLRMILVKEGGDSSSFPIWAIAAIIIVALIAVIGIVIWKKKSTST
jgi:hypothetical protein